MHTINDDSGIFKLNQKIQGQFHRYLLNEFYIDCIKDKRLMNYFNDKVINECLFVNKEWLISHLYPNLFHQNDNFIVIEKKQLLSDLNSFIRSKYSSIRECFQVPQNIILH